MELAHIALENLSISPANMRHDKKAPDIADILPSVRTRGVLVPLLVRPNGTPQTFEIVAGRRRFFAAKTVAAEGGSGAPLPCGILAEGDDADALEASLIENIHRLDPDEMSQYETFAKLLKTGKTPDDIAATFGLTPRQVAQRLALGNLLPQIREAYRAENIDATSIQHLTLATKRQQQEWLKLFTSDDARAPTGHQLKQWLLGGQAIPTALALFPLDGMDDQITADLFGEDSYFRDPETFWTKQNEAIAARREAYLAAGWEEVVILDQTQHFQTWEHEKCAKRKGGKVFIAVSPRGDVTFHEGYVTRKEASRKAKTEAKGDKETETPAARPEVSSGLQTYIDLHRLAAVRAALVDDAGVALRLMLAHAIGGSRLWNVSPESMHSGREATDESVNTSACEKTFAARRAKVLALLDFPENASLLAGHDQETPAIFARLLSLSDAKVMIILAVVMAESLEVGNSLVESVSAHLKVDLRGRWRADDAFFDLVRDKETLAVMIGDLAGKRVANAYVAVTGKVQKGIVRDCLSGTNGREKVADWVPRWLEFPVRGYKTSGGFQTLARWKAVSKLL